jgi:tetratricopeptide (TPR) repeat protein
VMPKIQLQNPKNRNSPISVCCFKWMSVVLFLIGTLNIQANESITNRLKSGDRILKMKILDSINYQVSSTDSANVIKVFIPLEKQAGANTELNALLQFYRILSLIHMVKNQEVQVKELEKLDKKCIENNFLLVKAEVQQLLANTYWDNKNYKPALENYFNAHEIYDKLSYLEFPHKAEYLYQYGGKYYHYKDYFSAKAIYLEVWNTIPEKYILSTTSKINTIALCYTYLQQFDSAMYYFQKAEKHASINKDSIWFGILAGNVANVLCQQRKFKEAIPLLEKNIIYSRNHKILIDLIISLSSLGRLYLLDHRNTEALELAREAQKIIKENKFQNNLSIVARGYSDLAKIYFANHLYSQAYFLLDSAGMAKDSLQKQSNSLLLSGVQMKFGLSQQQALLLQQKTEIEKVKIIRNAIFAGFLLILIILLLVYNRYREKNKANKLLDTVNKELNELNIELEKTMDELKTTQELVLQNERMAMIGMVAERMAHEIQNPMNFVNNFSELSDELINSIDASTSAEEKEEIMELLKVNISKVNHHGKRASQIIKELLEQNRKGTVHPFFNNDSASK